MVCICTYIWLIFMANVDKYTSPMDPVGIIQHPPHRLIFFHQFFGLNHWHGARNRQLVPGQRKLLLKPVVYTCQVHITLHPFRLSFLDTQPTNLPILLTQNSKPTIFGDGAFQIKFLLPRVSQPSRLPQPQRLLS